MSLALIKMWFALGAIVAMFISVVFILLSRHKVNNKFLKAIMAFIAYALMLASGFVIFFVVFSGPVNE
ncbi:DUF2768 domain-containing protein [Bacillus sp. 165]|uniref:DUF2768 domain-containing protein n=1 Tax=Bacillus sp. 165 TaxID=1529117 RepID=UPI001ADC7407|nr:DUF2768 domain-containing protein [Bacillus sp. 165]MBO9128251.1 DUF2768 domain-containing protein [Bacillus sp. 165]